VKALPHLGALSWATSSSCVLLLDSTRYLPIVVFSSNAGYNSLKVGGLIVNKAGLRYFVYFY
jgi:hypothetical protein